MEAFVVILLRLCLTVLLIPQYSADSETDMSCEKIAKLQDYDVCQMALSDEIPPEEISNCVKEIIKSRSKYNPSIQSALSAFISQYCHGVGDKQGCYECFRDVFKDVWNQNICLEEKIDIFSSLQVCLENHNNTQFVLSKKMNFDYRYGRFLWNVKPVTFNLSAEEYRSCSGIFPAAILPKDNLVVLNVYPRSQDGTNFQYVEILLSLFLEAIKVKNGSIFTEVTCEHIMALNLLSDFKNFSKAQIKPVPLTITKIYSPLRTHMCKESSIEKPCRKCFQKVDNLFTSNLYNAYKTVDARRKDFEYIEAAWTNCSSKVTSTQYSSLQNFKDSSHLPATWKASHLYSCLNKMSPSNKLSFGNDGIEIKLMKENQAFLNILASYYFAFHIYQLDEVRSWDRCSNFKSSLILCAVAQAMYTIAKPRSDVENADDQLRNLMGNLRNC